MKIIKNEKLKKIYNILIDYTNRAIEYDTGIAIEEGKNEI